MSKEYKNVMDKITMDKDMKKRILFNLENINEENDHQEKADSFKLKIMHNNFKKNIGMFAACSMVIICCIANKSLINILKPRDINSQSLELSQNADSNESNPDISFKDKDSTSIEKIPEIENSTDETSTDSKSKDLPSKKTYENSEVQKSYSKSEQNNINSAQKDVQSQDMTSNSQNDNSQTNIPHNNEDLNLSKKIDDNNSNKKSVDIDKSPMIAKSSIEDFNNLSDLMKSVDFEFKIPQMLPKGFNFKTGKLISQQAISITYVDSNDTIEFIASKGNNVISNTLEKYDVEKIVNLKIGDITLKGDNKLINLVTWIQDGISYCISAPNGLGEDEALNMVKSIAIYK